MSARPRLGWQLLAISKSSQGVYMYKKAGFNSRPFTLHHQQSDIAAIRLTTQQKDPSFTTLHHSFRMRFAVATAVSLTVLSSVSALFPLPSGLGQSGCSNQNGALNLELLTSTNCYSNGGAAPMSCGNQGGDPSGSGILGGLLGSGALINVNALNTLQIDHILAANASFRPHIESTSLRRYLKIMDIDCIPQISDFVFT
ncbi:hypothetical protein PSHT_05529 [Puccinia striiformis]|uniref:Uncharacterized protein n=1 Tax=Puccinia striiformis TaxID=27350 RepID=A0A2S4WAF3_9BASI|nr:hypothetical protein PSHT_05529 [Puccinia striiformis]